MNRETILRLAREAGFEREMRHEGSGVIVLPDAMFERFAALITAAERQRCAAIAREFDTGASNHGACIAQLIEA